MFEIGGPEALNRFAGSLRVAGNLSNGAKALPGVYRLALIAQVERAAKQVEAFSTQDAVEQNIETLLSATVPISIYEELRT